MAPAQQLAAPLATSASGAGGSEAAAAKTVRASPAHGMLVGHAMLFGAVTASKEVGVGCGCGCGCGCVLERGR